MLQLVLQSVLQSDTTSFWICLILSALCEWRYQHCANECIHICTYINVCTCINGTVSTWGCYECTYKNTFTCTQTYICAVDKYACACRCMREVVMRFNPTKNLSYLLFRMNTKSTSPKQNVFLRKGSSQNQKTCCYCSAVSPLRQGTRVPSCQSKSGGPWLNASSIPHSITNKMK